MRRRIGSTIIFHLCKLCKAKFVIRCGVIFCWGWWENLKLTTLGNERETLWSYTNETVYFTHMFCTDEHRKFELLTTLYFLTNLQICLSLTNCAYIPTQKTNLLTTVPKLVKYGSRWSVRPRQNDDSLGRPNCPTTLPFRIKRGNVVAHRTETGNASGVFRNMFLCPSEMLHA